MFKLIDRLRDEMESAYDQFRYRRDRVERVRQIARCVEYGTLGPDTVRPWLLKQLKHRHARVRNAATEALWQIADTKARRDIEKALLKEKHEAVRKTMEHVIHVMGG